MKRLFLTAILSIALFSVSAQTQQPEQTEPSDLSARIAALEAQNSQTQKRLFSMPKISGFINIPYEYTSIQGEGTSASSLNIKRARLKVSGQIGAKVEYCMQADFAGTPRVLDAYVRYKMQPWLSFHVGQSKTIFGFDNSVYVPLVLETIENPASASSLSGGSGEVCGVASTGRDIGVSAYGAALRREEFNILEYAVAVYNGSGINKKDDNKSKDVAARIYINPSKEVTIAASAYFGQYGTGYYHRDRYSLGVRYDGQGILFRTEYLYGNTGSANGTFFSQGGYASLSYWVLPCLRPILRYDVMQNDKDKALLQNEYLAGLDYWPIKSHLRLQANYSYIDFHSTRHKNIHKFALMLTAAF